jgi:hypothetical protein
VMHHRICCTKFTLQGAIFTSSLAKAKDRLDPGLLPERVAVLAFHPLAKR